MPTAETNPRRKQPRKDRRTRSAKAEGLDAREALLEAALEVFAERGFRDSSVDEIAERAGYSKGAVYWHFSSKDDLFFALLEERIDRPWNDHFAILESSTPDQDMALEASRRLADFLRGEKALLLLEHEYWSLAIRDPKLRERYSKRQARLRAGLAKAIVARLEHLGAPPLTGSPEDLATAFISLVYGLGREKLIDPATVPENLLGDTLALIYAGHVARQS
jgi:AcrR family transcriptional regulator